MIPASSTAPRTARTRKRFPALVTWGRRVQVAGGLLLLLAPFLPWAQVPLLGLSIPLPGVFVQGLLLVPLALVMLGALLAGLRHPWLALAIAAASGTMAFHAARTVMVRTPYWLKSLQLWLSDLNQALARMGARTIDVVPRGMAPADYVGFGLTVAGVGATALALGALLETLGYARTTRPLSALVGLPRCRQCGTRTTHAMPFCPGCGARHSDGDQCACCEGDLRDPDAFCPWCGHARPRPPAVGVRD